MSNEKIHIGNLIYSKLKEDGRSASWLAKKIFCERANIYRIFRKPSINTNLLLDISIALEIDFFVYYSNIYYDYNKRESENSN